MIAQEDGPLAVFGNLRCLLQNVYDRKTVLHTNGHKHTRHEREVKSHIHLITVAKVSGRILRPLISFRQEHAVLESLIHVLT